MYPTTRDIHAAIESLLIVIPSINGGSMLERMFSSMRNVAHRTIVLDQASTDDTPAICERFGVQLLQLGETKTYTQACNIGLTLAKEKNCKYLVVANNDVRLITDVCQQLLREMLKDDNLAIAAPAQLVIDERLDEQVMTYRVQWDLENVSFEHDRTAPDRRCERLEADFCELTFALIRISAADEVGFLDDDYGFYHEDADFCFRLRQAGFAAAYVPQAQIEHYTSSTFSANLAPCKSEYIRKNRVLFAGKHLGYGVKHADHRSTGATSWEIINRNMHRYLRRNGLVNPSRPELIFAHPGTRPFDYLYTAWETSRLPLGWADAAREYKRVLTASRWVKDVFEAEGVQNVSWLPHGVETDVYTPWGTSDRPFDETTFLWFARNQRRKGLDIIRRAWRAFKGRRDGAQLIIMGNGVLEEFGLRRQAVQAGSFLMASMPEDRVNVWEIVAPLCDADVALVYRSVDFYVSTARSEGFGFSTAEAMGCGTPPIFGGYGGSNDLAYEGALLFSGQAVPADYSDKGFENVGNWWEPEVSDVIKRLDEASSLDDASYVEHAEAGRRHITAGFTWRHTCFGLREILARVQYQAEVAAASEAGMAPSEIGKAKNEIVAFANRLGNSKNHHFLENLNRFTPFRRKLINSYIRRVFADFDDTFYNAMYPDIANSGAGALEHYINYGWKEGRRPSGHFDTYQYLAANSRVRQALLQGIRLPFNLEDAKGKIKNSVIFIGYVEASLGLGESLRNLITAVSEEKFPFAIYPYNVLVEDRYSGPFMADRYDFHGEYKIRLFEGAADQLPAFYEKFGSKLSRSYNIFRTYWELEGAPSDWRQLLKPIHEVWAPTNFIAKAFRTVYDGPIILIPPYVNVKSNTNFERTHFGMDRSRFYYLFSFDYNSWPTRKNPGAVLQAFQMAFSGSENVGLIIKSTGVPNHSPRTRALIAEAAHRDSRIRVIDSTLERAELLSLIQMSDCYVSLHRSEGFGLGMAEAMAMGKAVIGTAYSGNIDFLTEKTGFPVPYQLRPLLEGEYAYTDQQSWAEPDVEAAAEIFRQVYHEPKLRQARASEGQKFISTQFGPKYVGRSATNRLREILSTLNKD